jgi:hypothetical protein
MAGARSVLQDAPVSMLVIIWNSAATDLLAAFGLVYQRKLVHRKMDGLTERSETPQTGAMRGDSTDRGSTWSTCPGIRRSTGWPPIFHFLKVLGGAL